MRAYVFSGGGALAVSELGIASYLIENNMVNKDDFVAGTSFGAITSAVLKTEMPRDKIKEMLKTFDKISKQTLKPKSMFFEGLTFLFKWGFADLIDILAPYFGNVDFPENMMICATELETMKPVYFSKSSKVTLLDAVATSASIPFIFAPHVISGKHYVDGGVVDNLPTATVPSTYKDVVITGSYPSDEYKFEINNFSTYVLSMISGGVYYMNKINLKKLQNATVIPIKSKSQNVLDFSHWQEDFAYGLKTAEEFFKIHDTN